MKKIIFLVLISLNIFAITPSEILKKVDYNMTPMTIKYDAKMIIHQGNSILKKEMKVTAKGADLGYIEFVSPVRDKGTKYLRTDSLLYIYFPSANKTQKLSGHMLRQNMMGSDLSYEDQTSRNKLNDLYNSKIIKETNDTYVLELILKPNEENTYYKRVLTIDKNKFVLLNSLMYANSGKLLKEMTVIKYEKLGDRYYITNFKMEDKIKKNSYTELVSSNIEIDVNLSGDISGSGSVTLSQLGNGTLNIPNMTLESVGTAGTYAKVTTNTKGQVVAGTTLSAGDIPSLDASKITSGIIDIDRLPASAGSIPEYATLSKFPLVGDSGKVYIALDTNKMYRWSGSTYVSIAGGVDSVAGKTGVVSLAKGDVGLANVDNTSDINKPISTATQTALNTKVDITTNQTIAGIKTFSSAIAGSITGNSGTATKLATARTINGVAFDGSANITVSDDTKLTKTNPAITGSVTEQVYNLTGTVINPANGTIQYKTVSSNTTFTETLISGQSVLLRLINANKYTITFPTITWVGAVNPVPVLTANCAIALWKEQSTLYGAYIGTLV